MSSLDGFADDPCQETLDAWGPACPEGKHDWIEVESQSDREVECNAEVSRPMGFFGRPQAMQSILLPCTATAGRLRDEVK
jgi:hypothetical protein